jgi:hypothetical protein
MVILIVLGTLFVCALLAYCRQSFIYNRYAKERKTIKRELMKIKDTEYTNFLLQGNIQDSSKGKKVSSNINDSAANLDDSD